MGDRNLDRLDIHHRQRRLELALKNVESSSMSESNKKAILGFCDNCRAEGLSVERVEHFARILKKICER